jgi:thiol-disulfide isomerase/thioredoxin
MTTSKPARLVFFKKEGCGPCDMAYSALQLVLAENPEYEQFVSVIQKENAPSLVAAYELELYPTVLIMDKDSNVLSRKVGSSSLTMRWWYQALTAIAKP